MVEKKYPDVTALILTDDYLKALQVGYVELARFIPENEAELCSKAHQLMISEDNPSEKINEYGSLWFDTFIKIHKKITEKSANRNDQFQEKIGDVVFRK